MRLADGRMVHGAGYCWICAMPKASIDDRTCGAIACEAEHRRRLAMPQPPLAEAAIHARRIARFESIGSTIDDSAKSRALGVTDDGCGKCYGCKTGRLCAKRKEP